MAKRKLEPAPGQMSTDDFKDLGTLHKMDLDYFHRDCDGTTSTESDGKVMRSWCNDCELLVTSTITTLGVVATRGT